jgi:hypothetical protein
MLSKSRTLKSLFRRNVCSLVRDFSFRITAGSPNSGEIGLPAEAVAPTPRFADSNLYNICGRRSSTGMDG